MKYVIKMPWRYPLAIEQAYQKKLVSYAQSFFRAFDSKKDAIYAMLDASSLLKSAKWQGDSIRADDEDTISDIIEQIASETPSIESMKSYVTSVYSDVNDYNGKQFNKLLESVRVNAYGGQWQGSNKDMEQWVNENLDLIVSIREETLRKIKSAMRDAVSSSVEAGVRNEVLTKQIQRLAGNTKARARLIARDQIGKANGRMTEYRQRELDIKQYRWRDSGDSRVRPEHAARGGKIFDWDNPPPDGHPGIPIQCRCTAQPVIDFDRLAEMGFYTPRTNRRAVAKAMKMWGKPVGALYEQFKGAEPVIEESKRDFPYENIKQASIYFKEKYGIEIRSKFTRFDKPFLFKQFNMLDELFTKFDVIKYFTNGRAIDSKFSRRTVASVSSDSMCSYMTLKMSSHFYCNEKWTLRLKKDSAAKNWDVKVDDGNELIADIVHEFGHIIHLGTFRRSTFDEVMQMGKKANAISTYAEFAKRFDLFIKESVEEIREKAKEFDTEGVGEEAYMSIYGRSQPAEWFAEAFCHWYLSKEPNPAGQAMEWWLRKEGWIE